MHSETLCGVTLVGRRGVGCNKIIRVHYCCPTLPRCPGQPGPLGILSNSEPHCFTGWLLATKVALLAVVEAPGRHSPAETQYPAMKWHSVGITLSGGFWSHGINIKLYSNSSFVATSRGEGFLSTPQFSFGFQGSWEGQLFLALSDSSRLPLRHRHSPECGAGRRVHRGPAAAVPGVTAAGCVRCCPRLPAAEA